jgi:hypothetical protein
MFGFVAHKNVTNNFNGNIDNSCLMFAELDPGNFFFNLK